MRAFDGRVPVGVPAHRYLPHHPSASCATGGLTSSAPCIDKFFVGHYRDQVVGKFGEFVDSVRAGHRHDDADRHVGHVPQPRGVHLKVIASPAHQPAAEQLADDLNGFTQANPCRQRGR